MEKELKAETIKLTGYISEAELKKCNVYLSRPKKGKYVEVNIEITPIKK